MINRIKVFVFFGATVPLARLVWLAASNGLGANPVEFVIRSLGTWTLILLMVTLSMTPLRILTGSTRPIQLRRMLGLFTFFYATLHLLAYAGLDQWFDWAAISKDLIKHPFVYVGFSAFLLLIPLAATSNKRAIKRLGKRWQALHRAVYLVAILGVVHYWWLVKKDIREPLLFAVVLAVLFGIRLFKHRLGLWNTRGTLPAESGRVHA